MAGAEAVVLSFPGAGVTLTLFDPVVDMIEGVVVSAAAAWLALFEVALAQPSFAFDIEATVQVG